jgi:hypothetical protein
MLTLIAPLFPDKGINEKRSVKHDYFEFKACREFKIEVMFFYKLYIYFFLLFSGQTELNINYLREDFRSDSIL